jgi:hypothetical protein
MNPADRHQFQDSQSQYGDVCESLQHYWPFSFVILFYLSVCSISTAARHYQSPALRCVFLSHAFAMHSLAQYIFVVVSRVRLLQILFLRISFYTLPFYLITNFHFFYAVRGYSLATHPPRITELPQTLPFR